MRSKYALLPALALIASTSLSACTSGSADKQVEDLKSKVKLLETENASLRQQITALTQTSVAINPNMQTVPLVPVQTAATTTAPATEPAPRPDFEDINAEVPNADLITDLKKVGIFDELTTKFEPYKPVTRGEYCVWLFKANNAMVPKNHINFVPQAKPFFSDLSADHPSYKYVQALKAAGYSVGYEDGTFKADKPITREEMISMKVGFDRGKDAIPNRAQLQHDWKFTDTKAVADRFTGLIDADIYVYGPKGGNVQRAFGKISAFRPQEPVVRCEAAGTLWQIGDNVTRMGTAEATLKDKTG